jgi:hypothetical protein
VFFVASIFNAAAHSAVDLFQCCLNAKPFAHLKHAEVWIPQLANQTYLEVERE